MNEDFHAAWADHSGSASEHGASSDSSVATKAAKPQMKQIVTIRLDVDTLAWFKDGGPGYQTRINQILRDHMDAQRSADTAAGAPN